MIRVSAARIGFLVVAAVLALVVIGFYGQRLWLPLPLYAGDEGSYLLRGVYNAATLVRAPDVPNINNGTFIGLIRVISGFTDNYLFWVRVMNAAGYFGGLILLQQVATRGLPRTDRAVFLLLAVSFPYFRFVFSALPESLYVGIIAAIGAVTAIAWRTRPIVHSLAAGALCALLILTKPHGVTMVAAMGALFVVDAVISREWLRLPLRVVLFALAFYAVGNVIQMAMYMPMTGPLTFFISPFYGAALGTTPPPEAPALGALAALAMSSAIAVMAGIPVVIALLDLFRRWRAAGRKAFVLAPEDVLFLLILLGTLATIAMVTVFTMKISVFPAEQKRLWGRYFEFWAPLLWLAGARQVFRFEQSPIAWARWLCAAVMIAGLGGLLLSFKAGIVLFPWDASTLMAFFKSDPVRAPLGELAVAYRLHAIAAVLIAAALVAWRLKPSRAGVAVLLSFGLLGAHLESMWGLGLINRTVVLAEDLKVASGMISPLPGGSAVIDADNNDAHMTFMSLGGRPYIYTTPPEAPAPQLPDTVTTLIVMAGKSPPPTGWQLVWPSSLFAVYKRVP